MSSNPLILVTDISGRKNQKPDYFAQLEQSTRKLNSLIAKSNALLSDMLIKENDTDE